VFPICFHMFLFLIFPRCFQICSIMGGCQIQYGKAVCADTRRDSADRRASVESHSTSPTTSGLCPVVVEFYPTAIPLPFHRAAADRLRAERQLDAQRRVQSESERLSLERVARSQAAAALCRLLLPAHQSELAASNPNHNPANNA
jgi:hypothetical protein